MAFIYFFSFFEKVEKLKLSPQNIHYIHFPASTLIYTLYPSPFHQHCSAGSDEKCLQGEWKNGLLHTTNLFFTFNFHHKETEFCLPTLYFTTLHWCTGILTLIFLGTFLLELWKLIKWPFFIGASLDGSFKNKKSWFFLLGLK